MINSTLNAYDPVDYDNWVDIPYGYQEEGDWMDTIWGPGYVIFKSDIFGGVVPLHCHILIHEDQGAMGTVYINNGCDGDYGDIGDVGSCEYVDSCEQFGPYVPSLPPTVGPEVVPSPTMPTPDPTAAVMEADTTASITVLQLTIKGSLNNFKKDAEEYTNGVVEDYGVEIVRFAMEDLDTDTMNGADIDIEVTLVERGSVKVSKYNEVTCFQGVTKVFFQKPPL